MADRVLLTGVSGFVAKHVALALLGDGFLVRGTVRSAERAVRTRETLRRHGADVSRLEFIEADLTEDDGWDEAVENCRFVVHTASPFPSVLPADKFALVPTAAGGTNRVVGAAVRAGAERIVLTSSVAAVYYGHLGRASHPFCETDWSNVASKSISAYAVSKTEAERAAWRAVAELGKCGSTELSVLNPAFVLGPLLDDDPGTSAKLVAMMMNGRLPAVPDVSLGIVDARDVAEAHLRALTVSRAAGRRFILSGGSVSMLELGRAIAAAEPSVAAQVPRFVLPDGLLKVVAMVSTQARSLVAELGPAKVLDTGPARGVLGLDLRNPTAAIAAMAGTLREMRLAGNG